MRGEYRMTWPVLDPRVPLADLLTAATVDLRSACIDEGVQLVAPVRWTLTPIGGGLRLEATVAVANGADVGRPVLGIQPCGTHAAFNRHKTKGEPIDEECLAGERAYQRNRRRTERRGPVPAAATG